MSRATLGHFTAVLFQMYPGPAFPHGHHHPEPKQRKLKLGIPSP